MKVAVRTTSGKWTHVAYRYNTTAQTPRYDVVCRRVPRQHAFSEVQAEVDCPHCLRREVEGDWRDTAVS